LRLIGVLASGETPSTDEAADALVALQQLLDDWSTEELLVHATRTAAVTLANTVQSYAIPGARPVKILSADVVTNALTFPVKVVGPDAWAQIVDRNHLSALTEACYCDYAYPTAAVLVSPIPNAAATLNLYCMVDLATVALAGDTFALPEGYARAVRFNLAVDLAGEFARPVDPAVLAVARETKAGLKTLIASNRAGKSALAVPPVPSAEAA